MPKPERGLGLRNLKYINMAMQIKLSQTNELGRFLRYKFVDRYGNIINQGVQKINYLRSEAGP